MSASKKSFIDNRFKSTSDGWRGEIAGSFTFDLVSKIAFAIGQYILSRKASKRPVLISYDSRFLSKQFAKRVARVLSLHNIQPLLSETLLPTPVLSFRVKQKNLFCGITITASHNPYWYNGIKIRMGYGGPPDAKVINGITEFIPDSKILVSESVTPVASDNPRKDYVKEVRKFIDMDLFRSCSLKILVDPMHGATTGLLKEVFNQTGVTVDEINNDYDPYFGGVPPEPKACNTLGLQERVSAGGYDLGVAHDGDGDRIVGTIPGVSFLSSHDIVAILLWYLVKVKKQKGAVVGSVVLSRRVARLTDHFNLKYHEVPIGFRHACGVMRNKRVIIAGEENGGVGFGFYLPERDGTMVAAMLAEAELGHRRGIREILKQIAKIAGPSGFCRLDIRSSQSCNRESLIEKLESTPPEILGGQAVKRISNTDGVKFYLDNGDWVNVRASGTENLIRIYAEAENNGAANQLAKEMRIILGKLKC